MLVAYQNSTYQCTQEIPYCGNRFGIVLMWQLTQTQCQKLSYLQAQLQGDAARVIAEFPLTNANYGHSIALLQDRFGQPYKLVSAHMQALLDLPNPTNTLTSL